MWKQLLRYDWCSLKGSLLIAFLAFCVRLPLCFAGPGFDGDSYLNLIMAMRSRESGTYFPSRGPGYIVPDLITQALAPYGWVYLNLLSSFVASLSIPLFAAILRATEARHRNLLLWVYALLPYPLVAYADVMVEYSLALFGFLLGWLMAIQGRWIGSAALWGVGAAMRPSQGVVIVLMFLLSRFRYFGSRQSLLSGLISVVTLTLLWLLPLRWLTGSWELATVYLPYQFEIGQWVRHVAVLMVAQVGVLPLALLAFTLWRYRADLWKNMASDFSDALSALVALATFLLFLRYPFKTNYLLLGVPFLVYLLSAVPSQIWVRLIGTALLLQNLVSIPSSPPLGTNQPVGAGLPFANWQNRRLMPVEVARLFNHAPSKSVTVCAEGTLWFIEYEYISMQGMPLQVHRKAIYDPARDRWFLWVNDARALKQWLERGYSVRITHSLHKILEPSLIREGLQDSVRKLDTARSI